MPARLVDIGIKPYGMLRLRFSRCEACGAEYPHVTQHTPAFAGFRETPGPMLNGREITHCPCQTSGSNKGDSMSDLAIERVITRAVHCHVHAVVTNDSGCIKELLESAADAPLFCTTLVEYLRNNLGNHEISRAVMRLADFAYQRENTSGLPGVARNIIVQVFMLREESEPADDV